MGCSHIFHQPISSQYSYFTPPETHKMVKHTHTICQLLPTNCLSVFDHFVVFRRYKMGTFAGYELKGRNLVHSQMFLKIGVLENFAMFAGKYLCRSLFLVKLQTWRPPVLLKRDSTNECFISLYDFLGSKLVRLQKKIKEIKHIKIKTLSQGNLDGKYKTPKNLIVKLMILYGNKKMQCEKREEINRS